MHSMPRLLCHAFAIMTGLLVASATGVYAHNSLNCNTSFNTSCGAPTLIQRQALADASTATMTTIGTTTKGFDQILENLSSEAVDMTAQYDAISVHAVVSKAFLRSPCADQSPHAYVYVGAIIGATDLASAENVPNLQASHDTSFYLTSYALTQVLGLSVATIQRNWSSQGTGIIEVGTDPVVMPDIATNYGFYVTASQHWTWGGVKGSTWPSLIAAGGWAPKIAMLNEFLLGTTNSLSDPYYLMDLAAIADVKAAAPSIQYVLPYLTANAAPVIAANNDTDWTSPYWGESRAIALAGGGLGIDTPANYFNVIREPGFRTLTVQEIKWATSNGLLSVVLLSPYNLGAAAGTIPQFQYDPTFMRAVRQEVSFLHSQRADPTFYVVANYSEGAGTNVPGSDTDPNGETVNAVALWVARNAPTSPTLTSRPWQWACSRQPQGHGQHPDRRKSYQQHKTSTSLPTRHG